MMPTSMRPLNFVDWSSLALTAILTELYWDAKPLRKCLV
jgi:hypothetical protein